MKFQFIKKWQSIRFDGKKYYIKPRAIIIQIKPYDTWENTRGTLVGCGIDTLLKANLVKPLDNQAERLIKKFKKWKKFTKEHPNSLSAYAIYGGFGYKLLEGYK